MTESNEELLFLSRAQSHSARLALTDANSSATYQQLLDDSARVATAVLTEADDLQEARIAFLLPPSIAWVSVLWGIWRAGGVAVPLPMGATRPELEYLLADTSASALICDAVTAQSVQPAAEACGVRLLLFEQQTRPPALSQNSLPSAGQ